MKFQVVILAAALLVASCGPFSRSQPVRVGAGEEDRSSRWQASISSPQTLVGAVEMEGSAWMGPGENDSSTRVTVEVENASPGGVHPWEVREGRCGENDEIFGSRGDYEPLEVGNDGRGTSSATLSEELPESGSYSVAIFAAPGNRDLIVACGNLAPPSG